MKVGDSVRKAIDDAASGDGEAAMLHACNAVDGTAKKRMPNRGSRERFISLLRTNAFILGPMALPGIDILTSRFPVSMPKMRLTDDLPDFAEVVYGIHRCCHGHGDELPQGFELIPEAHGPTGITTGWIDFERGAVRLSDRVIFGLLAVAVMSPMNLSQRVPDGYYLKLGDTVLMINEWWGRANDFPDVAAKYPMPLVTIDPRPWPESGAP